MNKTDIDGAIISAVLKVVGRMILYAAMNVGIQYLADKFLSLIYRKKLRVIRAYTFLSHCKELLTDSGIPDLSEIL